jgi:hypothetical protein
VGIAAIAQAAGRGTITSMVSVEHIDDWRGQEVVDADGEKLGKLADVYYLAGSDDAVFATVTSGLLGRKHHVVPLQGASLSRDYVRVNYRKDDVARAPDAGDALGDEDVQQLAGFYGLGLTNPDGTPQRLESASAREARLRASEEARARASQLEGDAAGATAAAHAARTRAEQAQREAELATDDEAIARQRAAEARRIADADDGPPPAA